MQERQHIDVEIAASSLMSSGKKPTIWTLHLIFPYKFARIIFSPRKVSEGLRRSDWLAILRSSST